MPVSTQHIRNNELVSKPFGWGYWHLARFHEAAVDEGKDPEGSPFENWTFELHHVFIDPDDGEVLEILPGDRFTAFR